MSRPLCRFATFDLDKVPLAQRGRALDLQVRQWSAFPSTGVYVLWSGASAMVWAWDSEAVGAAMATAGVDPRKSRVIPETILAPRPAADGSRLVQCLEGYEGQAWSGGVLAGSRWWNEAPSAAQWTLFQRDSGQPPEMQAGLPEPLARQWGEAWGPSQSLDASASASLGRERWVVPAVAMCLLVATCWYGAQLLKIRAASAQRTAEQRQLEAQAQPLLAARGDALEGLARLRALRQAVDAQPDQLALMAKVAESLPRDGSHLKSWDYSEGRLRVQVGTTSNLASSDWIRRFEALGPFRNVQILASNDASVVQLGMEIRPPERVASTAAGTR